MVFFDFKVYLKNKTDYSKATIEDIVSRLKRANAITEFFDSPYYLYILENQEDFKLLSSSVKSQIRKSVNLYLDYLSLMKQNDHVQDDRMQVLSLFANIGVAEACLDSSKFHVAVANELIERRAALYADIYPNAKMICGDITNDDVFENVLLESAASGVQLVMATPPCQGMSTAGQLLKDDYRNTLICPVIEMVKSLEPNYVFLENVPNFLNTSIVFHGENKLIPDIIAEELCNYHINHYVINTADYSVPQTRERAIFLLTKNDTGLIEWRLPPRDNKVVTMKDAIGSLPKLDPYVYDVTEEELLEMFPHFYERKDEAARISPWHVPPKHPQRQVVAMMHTPTGKTAFENAKYFPKKKDGSAVSGYFNTYKRQNWDTPAYTVTMDNRKISSQNNVHPGRFEGLDVNGDVIYSDARVLTLYEIMKISSIPDDWPVPINTPMPFLRSIIGEGIPPLFVKKVFDNLIEG